MQAPLAQRHRRRALDLAGKLRLGADAEAVVAHAVQRPSSRRLRQTQPAQHADARRHQPLATGFLAREPALLVELDAQSGATQQHRQRGAGDAAARDQDIRDVGHGIGTNRGLPPITAR